MNAIEVAALNIRQATRALRTGKATPDDFRKVMADQRGKLGESDFNRAKLLAAANDA